MGKGLMTVWRVTNPHAGDIPTGIDFADEGTGASPISKSVSRNPRVQVRKPLNQIISNVSHSVCLSHFAFSYRNLNKMRES